MKSGFLMRFDSSIGNISVETKPVFTTFPCHETMWLVMKTAHVALFTSTNAFYQRSNVNFCFHNSPQCLHLLNLPLSLSLAHALPPYPSLCLLSATATFSEGLVARRRDSLPIVCRQRWRGCGRWGFTIRRTGDNCRPRGPALHNHGCVEEEDGQAWWAERGGGQSEVGEWQCGYWVEPADTLNSSFSFPVSQ